MALGEVSTGQATLKQSLISSCLNSCQLPLTDFWPPHTIRFAYCCQLLFPKCGFYHVVLLKKVFKNPLDLSCIYSPAWNSFPMSSLPLLTLLYLHILPLPSNMNGPYKYMEISTGLGPGPQTLDTACRLWKLTSLADVTKPRVQGEPRGKNTTWGS